MHARGVTVAPARRARVDRPCTADTVVALGAARSAVHASPPSPLAPRVPLGQIRLGIWGHFWGNFLRYLGKPVFEHAFFVFLNFHVA